MKGEELVVMFILLIFLGTSLLIVNAVSLQGGDGGVLSRLAHPLGKPLTPSGLAPRCCLAHDCCYGKLKQLGCQPVLNGYQFHIANGTVVCNVSCLCGLRACECDKQSAYCFRASLPTYEKNFKQLFSSRPRCGRRKLQC
uniref:Phospholipase A2 n=1 Tax=Canis lupus familiaris TaxID=9615 RepID=A0A8C0Q6P3_CANLF